MGRVIVCLGIVLSFAPSSYSQAAKDKFQLQTDIVYSTIGNHKMKLDLATPKEGKGPFPAVICVHGGAWRMGNKKELREWIEYLAEEGFVAVSVGYRLVPDCVWPEPLDDCQTAVKWLRANAEKYQVDPKKIGAMGFSAGGHLVSFLGMLDKASEQEKKDKIELSSKVQCVVNFFGPCDLCYYGDDETAQNAIFKPMLGYRFKENSEVYKKASPLSYITKETAPFLILHGTEDRLVPIDQSRKLAEKLKDCGVSAKLMEFKGEDHGWFGENRKKSTHATLDFLAEHLKK
jgi:acetyl esterase/lipase